MLALHDLSHRYTPEALLRFPDLQVPAGQHLLVHGTSGSGKSTLLALIAGLLTPFSGSVQLNGIQVNSLTPRQRDSWRGATLGVMTQRLHLSAGLDVDANLRLPFLCAGEPTDERRIADVMRHLGIASLGHRRPHELSVGQAQRVALARALLRRPRVILADEPTASLDDEAASDALTLLLQAATDHAAMLIIATHDRRATDALPGAHVLRLAASR